MPVFYRMLVQGGGGGGGHRGVHRERYCSRIGGET